MLIPVAPVINLLEYLTQVVNYNYHLIADVKENIVALQQALETLGDLMKDFAKYNHDSDYVEGIVKRIEKIICQAEDAVDTYLLRATVQKSRNWISKTFHKFTDYPKALRDIGKQIEEISNEVKKINPENPSNLVIQMMQYQATRSHNRPPNPKQVPIVEEDHVVGFEGATAAVSKLLTEGPEQLEVISVVGMLGLGKTTLAKNVLKDPKVDYEYRIRAFVYVSQEYEKKEVFLKILSCFPHITDDVNQMTEEKLEERLRKELTGKKYLIVLDDVWEKDDWDKLKGAFPNNNDENNKKHCRVLITTRNEEVAKHANKKIPFYKLDFLPPDKSRELLRWKVFEDCDFPPELREYEIQIADKCDGLPLALVVISGILCNDSRSVYWWKRVAESVEDYIARDDRQTTKVIGLMYKHLPNHLKQCFLYMGVFREDFEIPVWKLVRLWIAEGLIQPQGDLNLEDVAEWNLNELIYRNLVMVGGKTSNDRIKSCRMHDTLREFCKNQAKEENLFHEIKKDKLHFFLSQNETLGEYRRLCINNVDILDYISSKPSGKCVRSFLTFNEKETTIEKKWVSSIPKTFKLLKVLEIQSLIYSCFPVELSHLVLLKYVAISSHFSILPSAMSSMWNLQTLIVKTTSRTLQIEANIWEMLQLRHLHTNASTILPPLPDPDDRNHRSNVESLIQTLSTISPDSCGKEVFLRTPKVKKLGICGTLTKHFQVGGQPKLFGDLQSLRSLENLKLLNEDVASSLDAFPSHTSFPQQITKLTLLNTNLDWKKMSTLGKLEKLEVLKLKDNAFKGQLWETEKGGFPLLKHLHIGRTDLMVWEASVDHFPKLKCLRLYDCQKLQAVPHGLADIPSLQLVVLHCTNTLVASSARRLQVLKLQEAERDNKSSAFKLSVYPPDH